MAVRAIFVLLVNLIAACQSFNLLVPRSISLQQSRLAASRFVLTRCYLSNEDGGGDEGDWRTGTGGDGSDGRDGSRGDCNGDTDQSLPSFDFDERMLVYGKPVENSKLEVTSLELDEISRRLASSSESGGPKGKAKNNTARDKNLKKREVTIDDALSVSVYELADPSELVKRWMENHNLSTDPFGTVMWPGSIVASRLLKRRVSKNSTTKPLKVLILGCGTGVEALVAARLGCVVHALDVNPLALELLEMSASESNLIVSSSQFDLRSKVKLPLDGIDLVVASDILYNEDLALDAARRANEVLRRKLGLIVSDSQKFHNQFLDTLNDSLEKETWETIAWQSEKLASVTTNGILVKDDQTYDVDVRYISM